MSHLLPPSRALSRRSTGRERAKEERKAVDGHPGYLSAHSRACSRVGPLVEARPRNNKETTKVKDSLQVRHATSLLSLRRQRSFCQWSRLSLWLFRLLRFAFTRRHESTTLDQDSFTLALDSTRWFKSAATDG